MISKDNIIIFFVLLLIAGRIVSSIPRKGLFNKKKMFSDFTAIIVSVIPIVGISSPIIEYYFSGYIINIGLSVIGAAAIALGFVITFFANREIGKNWSAVIDKNADQKLVVTGIYKIIRHPLYFSGMVIIIGSCLYFQSRITSILIIFCFLIILWRIQQEERFLIHRFGNDYLEYMKKTKKIIPFLY